MTRRKHVDALARIVERTLDAHAVPRARRLLDVELAWVEHAATASLPGEERPRALRIRRVVETCRDEHLAALDADEGLIALGIPWEEVALAVRRRRRERAIAARRRCPRCESRMETLEVREGSGRSQAVKTHFRCPACGLGTRT
jgi:hypothetical protein